MLTCINVCRYWVHIQVFVGSVEAKSVVHDMLNLTCISLYRRIQYTVEMSSRRQLHLCS